MQTHIRAVTEQPAQRQSTSHTAQLLVMPMAMPEDARSDIGVLKSMQSSMNANPQAQKMQALQAHIATGVTAQRRIFPGVETAQQVEEEGPLQGKFETASLISNNSSPVQRVINIESDGSSYDNASQLPVVIQKIAEETKKNTSEIKKKIVAIKNLIESGNNPFTSYAQLWNQVNPKLDPLASAYVPISPTVIKPMQSPNKYGTIPFYRAMSNTEADPVAKSGEFGMRINNSGFESGIKFFATNIDYSINLSNRKNDEAYLKNENLPYTRMFTALVWTPDVYEGLVNDIGIHNDQGHTAKKLDKEWDESAEKSVEETNGQEWLSTVVKAQGGQSDTDEYGYVIKHESGGFNFGVKAQSVQNMKYATQSPIKYFNNLVSAIFEIGKFVMSPKK